MTAGDLITTDGQLEWRGSLLGSGTSFRLDKLTGWLDLVDFRGDDYDRPSRHGQFPGASLMTGEVDGKPHIVLKPALDAIGVDAKSQVDKLLGKSWATTGFIPVVAADGKTRRMVSADLRTFLMLLATIDERRVAEHVRPKLVAYQSEVADAIEAYWLRGAAINPRAVPAIKITAAIPHLVMRAESPRPQ